MTDKQKIQELEKELKALKERVSLIERVADLYPIKLMKIEGPFYGDANQQNNSHLKVN